MGKAVYHPKGERQKTIIKLLNSLEGRYSRWDIWQDFIVLSAVSIANLPRRPHISLFETALMLHGPAQDIPPAAT